MDTMKNTFIAIFALLLFSACSSTQVGDFKNWLASPSGAIAEQNFANRGLSKEECNEAARIVDSLWFETTAERLGREWQELVLTNDTLKLACACRTFGPLPADGRSLYISMHGGGECPKEVNDEQWMNQIYLYQPFEGVYIAPRAPWNTSDLWHKEGLDELLEKLIQACVVFEGVNPDKVYLLGYSAGGDGVWRLAPRMADKWAAASMMAGHPGEASQVNLLNLPYMIWMGENDHFYNRNILARETGEIMDSLANANPGRYIHQTNIIEGKGHWMDGVDADALSWMAQYRREPYPTSIVWRQERVVREYFYWLSAPREELLQGKTVRAKIEDNTIDIEECDYSRLRIYINDEMADLDKKVTVRYKGEEIFSGKVERTITNLYSSLNARNDIRHSFPCIIEVDIEQ